MLIGSMFSNPEEFLKVVESNKIEIGVYKSELCCTESEGIVKFAKLELSVLYYHCIETFLRLYIAHVENKNSRWFELSRDTNYRNFKSKAEKLSSGNFEFMNNNIDEITVQILYGVQKISDMDIPEGMSETDSIEIIKDWVSFAAKELLKVYDYNSYKHGLTVYSEKNGFTLSGSDGRNLEEHGDCLVFLNKYKEDNRYKWRKSFVFTPLDYRAVVVHILQGLINNIIAIGKASYTESEKPLDILFVGSRPSVFYEKVKSENPFGVSIESYSVGLEYLKEK